MSPSKTTYRAPRGMRDVLPDEIPAWELLEGTARRLARGAGYREIRPPLLEETELFTRSVGEVTDIVEKEMFTIQKSQTSLSLRPEGTAGVARAYLEAGYAKNAPLQKLYYTGPMFRYERPQKGRERMFTQFDVEAIGSPDPRLDAELAHLAASFFEALGLDGLEVRMNSMGDGDDRDRYREAVTEFVRPNLSEYSEESKRRFDRNVLRVLDSKVPRDIELNEGAPRLLEYLSPENRAHFDAVCQSLVDLGREPTVDPTIVRGLDYYTRTIFEIHYPELGARSALCGGGRYDHLIADLGGPDVPAVGFAIGFAPTMIVLRERGLLPERVAPTTDAYVVSAADPDCRREVLKVADELRRAGVSAVFDLEDKSLKSQMKAAGKGGHRLAVVIGPEELERGVVQLKDLAQQSQEEVARAQLVSAAARVLEAGAGS